MAESARPTVFLTGATGFVGGHCAQKLLETGCAVRASVRDPASARCNFLREMAARFAGNGSSLELLPGDLTAPGSLDEAARGCGVCIHTAAVVRDNYEKHPDEVLVPAIEGTANVVGACQRSGSVRRIVYVSSVATIAKPELMRPKELRGTPFTEEEWGQVRPAGYELTPFFGTYPYAKVQAEKKLKELWTGELVVFYPPLITGPQLSADVTSSNQVIRYLTNREQPMAPRLFFDWIDVRDLAKILVMAAFHATVTNASLIVARGETISASGIAKLLNLIDPKLKAPTFEPPTPVLRLVSYFDKRITKFFIDENLVPVAPFSMARAIETYGADAQLEHQDLRAVLEEVLESFRVFGISKR